MNVEEWEEVRLGDVCDMKYGKMPKKDDIVPVGYPIYSGYRVTGFHKEFMFEESQLIVVARGVGGTGDVKLSPPKCYLTNLSIALFLNEHTADKKYLYYLFQKLDLRSLDTGSAQSQITIADLKNYKIVLPPLPEQLAIAQTLSCLDDKIELNNRMNKTLEEMAQALFKNWFVDFEPFKEGEFEESEMGLIPKGWRVGTLEDICFLSSDKIETSKCSFDNYISTENMIPEKGGKLKSSLLPTQKKVNKYINGDILVSNIRTYFKKIWYADSEGGCSNDVLIFKNKDLISNEFLYCLLFSDTFFDYITATSKGTKMPRGDKYMIMRYTIVLPSDSKIIKKFSCIISAIINSIKISQAQTQTLTQLRNTLLPKLMSGEIRVLTKEAL